MREIKFRGIPIGKSEYVFGGLVRANERRGNCLAIKETVYNINNGKINLIPEVVQPETVGQYIEIKDKNGKEIFEGDWLDIVDPNGEKMDDVQCVFYDDYGGYFIDDNHDMIPIGHAINQGYEITVDGNKNQE